jgi:hypothetical protein
VDTTLLVYASVATQLDVAPAVVALLTNGLLNRLKQQPFAYQGEFTESLAGILLVC